MAQASIHIITPSTVSDSDTADTTKLASQEDNMHWYALRDLTRANAKMPAYKILPDKGIEIFTPMKWKIDEKHGRRKRIKVPVLLDLIFAHSDREALDSVISEIPNLQYRYARGAYCKPIVIRNDDMERFIRATSLVPDPVYFTPAEVSTLSVGKAIKIIGGPMSGVEGSIVNVRGARKKRVLVSIPDFIATVVEVEPEFIQFI